MRCDWCNKAGTGECGIDGLEARTLELKSPYHIRRNGGSTDELVLVCADEAGCERRQLRAADARDRMLRDSRAGQAGWDD